MPPRPASSSSSYRASRSDGQEGGLATGRHYSRPGASPPGVRIRRPSAATCGSCASARFGLRWRMRQRLIVLLLLLAPAAAGCTRGAGVFSEQNARAHVEMLAGTIGSPPVGTAPNSPPPPHLGAPLKGAG